VTEKIRKLRFDANEALSAALSRKYFRSSRWAQYSLGEAPSEAGGQFASHVARVGKDAISACDRLKHYRSLTTIKALSVREGPANHRPSYRRGRARWQVSLNMDDNVASKFLVHSPISHHEKSTFWCLHEDPNTPKC